MKIPCNPNILDETYEVPIKYRVFRYLNSSEVQEGYISYLPNSNKWLDCREKRDPDNSGRRLFVQFFVGSELEEDVGGPKIKNLELEAFYVFNHHYVQDLSSYYGLVEKSYVTIFSDGDKKYSRGVPGVLALWGLIKEDIKAWEKSERSPLVEFESRLKVAVDAALNATPGIDTKCLPEEFYKNLLEELMQL